MNYLILCESLIRISIIALGLLDLTLTWIYIRRNRAMFPKKDYKRIERNPLIIFLVNKMGINLGMIISILIIMTLIIIISIDAHIIFNILLFTIQSYAIINHYKNFKLLNNIREKLK